MAPATKKSMWEFANDSIMEFENCFSRRAAFRWFAIVVVGLVVRTDHLGLTSIIRALGAGPSYYCSLVHFFRSSAWTLDKLSSTWAKVVCNSGLAHKIAGLLVIIGDGTKQGKESRKTPGVQKMAQPSENSGKASFIHGHHFGAVGIVLGKAGKLFCALVPMRVHSCCEAISRWAGDGEAGGSHVVRMVRDCFKTAKAAGTRCLAVLDCYYLSVPALIMLNALNTGGQRLLELVCKVKMNAKAFRHPEPKPKGARGAPRKKGEGVKLAELFGQPELFESAQVHIYGKEATARFHCADLLWGRGLYQSLRFVLVSIDGWPDTIYASTDTSPAAVEIIEAYGTRFKTGTAFKSFKNVIAGFASHFWTKSMPKLNRFAKNGAMADEVAAVTDERKQQAIVKTLKATEGFALISAIALGLLQIGSLLYGPEIKESKFRWLRTDRSEFPSEATTADFMQKTFIRCLLLRQDLTIMQFIHGLATKKNQEKPTIAA